jgi:hypothetical protein
MENFEKHVPAFVKSYCWWLIFYPVASLTLLLILGSSFGGAGKVKVVLHEPITWLVIASSVQMASITTSFIFKKKGKALETSETATIRMVSLAVAVIFAIFALVVMYVR